MVDYSLFLSLAFILTESSFIFVALFAAYELLIGDFIIEAREESRRVSSQSRGRGYDTFESLEKPRHQSHRSLSPGGRRVRGTSGAAPMASQPGPREESSLLHPPSHSRGGINETRIAEEGYYSSPGGDARFASPGRGSTGDSTRRTFYKAILLALLSRSILLPIETYCLTLSDSAAHLSSVSPLLRCLLRISQTLPDIAFASALATIVIFCATIAFSAMPPLSPEPNESSMHGGDDTETIDDGTDRGGLLRERGLKLRSNVDGMYNADNTTKNTKSACCITAARFFRAVLASKKTFFTWNVILSVLYTVVFVTDVAIPHTSPVICEVSLWIFIAMVYSFLLISLCYAATLLIRALYSGIVQRKNADSLALRLIGSCTLLAIMFIDRVVRFSMAATHAIANLHSNQLEERMVQMSFRRNTIDYAISESLPVLFILFMMHRKAKEVHSDVLIMHKFQSIRNNLFGSTSRLGGVVENPPFDNTTVGVSASADGTETAKAGLGARQFQTYGGSRVDSFPSSGNQPLRNIPRAISSSGTGRPK
ncbi:hypothetical protein ACHAXA_010731 [Cyclostephanos tholiformis]|uniref:Gustatory receptor n=1 Tax=Cyclostephanos tholiformis TaxID=382380 RepID=A0ABD3REN2_9STRA